MKITEMPVKSLKPYDKNAKKHDAKQIANVANSIKRFGWQQPLVVDEDGVVVIGHCRLMAAKKLGMKTVPVTVASGLTEDEIRELRIADNKTNESPWDFDLLADDLEGLEFDGFDFDFDVDGVDGTEQTGTVEDEAPDPPENPVAKRGDIYQLGRHRLMCGDSTESTEVEKLMGGHTADIAITSPPYGESNSAKLRDHYERGKDKRKSLYQTHDDDIHGWIDLLNGAFANMQHYSVGKFVNIQMLADNKTDLINWLYANNESLVDVIIWDKTKAAPQMQSNVLNNQYEFLFVFCKDNPTRSIPYANFHGNVNNVIRLATGQNEFAHIHRAVYPVEFPASIMRIAENAESVLDLFGGTGTTLIASEQLGKSCYMMELDPHYVDVIIQRWENFTGQKAVKLNE